MVSTQKTTKKPAPKATKTLTLKTAEPKQITKKGLLNFLFSFNGHISKELFLGSTFILFLLITVLDMLLSAFSYYVMPNYYIEMANFIIKTILFIMLLSIGYKRAHSLGISGFYSIIGTALFKPYFALYAPKNDAANDNAYAPKFEKMKKIGSFFNKTMGRQILYIAIIGSISILSVGATYLLSTTPSTKESLPYIITFIIGLTGFNLLQVLLLQSKFTEKFYTPIVKVLSFIGYTISVIGVTIMIYTTYIFLALLQAMAANPMM